MMTSKQKHMLVIVAVVCALLILFVPFFSQGIESEAYLWWTSRISRPDAFPREPQMSAAALPKVPKELPFQIKVWVVKISDIKNISEQEAIVKELQQQGIPAYLSFTNQAASKEVIYIGPEVDHDAAKAIHDKLPPQLKSHATIEEFRPENPIDPSPKE